MNFFEAQDQARRSSRKMIFLFVLAVIGTVLAVNAVALGVTYFIHRDQYPGVPFDLWQPEVFGLVTLITVGIIFLASAFKTLQISGDGGKVARLLGGRRVNPQTT